MLLQGRLITSLVNVVTGYREIAKRRMNDGKVTDVIFCPISPLNLFPIGTEIS